MSQLTSLLSGFTTAILLATAWSCTAGAGAQNAFVTTKVTSCFADPKNNSLMVSTGESNSLLEPSLQYLPGAEGQTVLVADFSGLLFTGEPKIIRGIRSGIEEVRIGQFQESPPVCRISLTSRNPNLFKLVNFKSANGQVTVTWSNDANLAETIALAARASTSSHPRRLSPYIASKPKLPKATHGLLPAAAKHSSAEDSSQAQSPAFLPGPAIPSETLPSFHSQIKLSSGGTGTNFPPQPPSSGEPGAKVGSSQVNSAAADEDRSTKGKGFLGRLFAHMPALNDATVKAGDQNSHDKLTSADRANQQTPMPAATMKKQPSQAAQAGSASARTKAMDNLDEPKFTVSLPTGVSSAKDAPVPGPEKPPVQLSLSSDEGSVLDNLKVEISAQKQINYKTFRMHDPERYVVDFDHLPEVQSLALPESESPLYYRFRSGKLPSNPNISRFVIDLPDENVTVADIYDGSQNKLTLLLTKELKATRGQEEAPPLRVDLSKPPNPDDTPASLESTASLPSFNTSPARSKHLAATTIVLDAGHGGNDPGAQRAEVQEKDITLGITKKLKQLLEKQGMEVVMTRSDDTFVSLDERTKITNQTAPDLFLSVHINALESTSEIHGIETYYQTEQSRPLADTIHQSLVADLGAPDRSVRKARFYVINHTPVPAILAEVGFISNKDERQKLTTNEYQQKVAEALAHGVESFVANVSYNPASSGFAKSDSHPYAQLGAPLATRPLNAPAALSRSSLDAGTKPGAGKSSSSDTGNSMSSLNRVVR